MKAGLPALMRHVCRRQGRIFPPVRLVEGPSKMGGVQPGLYHEKSHGEQIFSGLARYDLLPQLLLNAAIRRSSFAVYHHGDLPGRNSGSVPRVEELCQGSSGALAAADVIHVREGVVAHQHVGVVHHERGDIGVQIQGSDDGDLGSHGLAQGLQHLTAHVGIIHRG